MRSNVSADTVSGPARPAGLEIRISIEKIQPLTGSAASSGSAPVAFVGWLELLRVIAGLTEATEQTASRASHTNVIPTQHERDGSLS